MGTRPKQALGWYLNGKDWWREVLAFYVTLTDRPGDTDEWLINRALVSSSAAPDLEERVTYLRKAIQAAFPAYKETSGARQLFDKLKLKVGKKSGNTGSRLTGCPQPSKTGSRAVQILTLKKG